MPDATLTPRAEMSIRELKPTESADLVYFSSTSANTRRFVDRLDRPAVHIALRPRLEGMIRVARPFVLIVPTYGGGARSGAVPRQVISFLNDPANRALLRGVIVSGNTNFGVHYCLAGPIIATKCRVPVLYRFELLGTAHDIDRVQDGLTRFWTQAEADQHALDATGSSRDSSDHCTQYSDHCTQ
jgi:protein involved in ribonucleotide reduction